MKATPEASGEKCRVVGTRNNGDKVVISTHDSRHSAETVMSLAENSTGFRELHIEGEDGKRLASVVRGAG